MIDSKGLYVPESYYIVSMRTNYTDIRAALPVEYQYSPSKDRWTFERKEVARIEVKKILVQYAREHSIAKAGDWADRAIEIIKSDPAYTVKAFLKCARKDRSRRVKGLDAFLIWLKHIGMDISGSRVNPTAFAQKHGTLAGRFYDALAAAGLRVDARARIRGIAGVFSNVIVGFVFSDKSPKTKFSYPEVPAPSYEPVVQEQVVVDAPQRNIVMEKWDAFVKSLIGDDPFSGHTVN